MPLKRSPGLVGATTSVPEIDSKQPNHKFIKFSGIPIIKNEKASEIGFSKLLWYHFSFLRKSFSRRPEAFETTKLVSPKRCFCLEPPIPPQRAN